MSTSKQTGSPARMQASPFEQSEGASHPPPPPARKFSAKQGELQTAMRWMRGAMVQEFIKRLRLRAASRPASLGNRMRKRKAALAMSAAVMTVSPGMVESNRAAPDYAAHMQMIDATKTRVHAEKLKVSEAMKEALAEEEGVRLTVYRDVAGYPTVGVGHLVILKDNLKVGDRISYEQALQFLEKDLETAEAAVQRLVGDLKVYQHEFDALVDLVYNVGEGNVSERASPNLNSAIANRDYQGIADELSYHHAGGAVAKGLVYRSDRRAAIFMDAAYHDPRPASISVAGNITT